MKKFFENKRLLISFITLVIVSVLVVGEVFAWFLSNSKVDSSSLSAGVTSLNSGDGSIGLEIIGGEGTNLILNPGDTAKIKLSLKNNEGSSKTIQLQFSSIKIKYNYSYTDRYIFTNDYYLKDTDTHFDPTTIGTDSAVKKTFMQSFIYPKTNKIESAVYVSDQSEFDSSYTATYLTDLEHPSQVVLDSSDYTEIATNVNIPISSYSSTGYTVSTDGKLTLNAGQSVDLYLILYFSPENSLSGNTRKCYGSYNSTNLELRNSNGFMYQDLSIDIRSVIQ
jgi:hypothetical protein